MISDARNTDKEKDKKASVLYRHAHFHDPFVETPFASALARGGVPGSTKRKAMAFLPELFTWYISRSAARTASAASVGALVNVTTPMLQLTSGRSLLNVLAIVLAILVMIF